MSKQMNKNGAKEQVYEWKNENELMRMSDITEKGMKKKGTLSFILL